LADNFNRDPDRVSSTSEPPGLCPDRRSTEEAAARAREAPARASLSRQATTETVPSITACNSIQNATGTVPATHLVRVTHPFHPLYGRQFICVGERYNRYGTRILLQVGEDTVLAVPRQWTDLVAPDPEVVIGGGRALFRIRDLLELVQLVDRLGGTKSVGDAK
jgi:hypothetical protein